MLAIKNPRRGVSIFEAFAAAAGILLLAGCMASGPRALLEGDKALQRGDYARAVEKLKAANELLVDDPRGWNLLGLAYHRSGQPQLAAQAYRKAMERDRSNLVSVAHFNLGCLLLEQGNPGAAADELRSFTMISNSAVAWVKLGQAQARIRQFDAAELSFAKALRLDKTNAEAYNDLGVVYLHRNRARDAQQYINAALQVSPKYPPALLNSALLAQQNAATKPLALQRYREYLALRPRPAQADAVSSLARQLEVELAPHPAPQTNAAVTVPSRAAPPAASNVVAVTSPPPATVTKSTNAPAHIEAAATPGQSNTASATVALKPPAPPTAPVTNTPSRPAVVAPAEHSAPPPAVVRTPPAITNTAPPAAVPVTIVPVAPPPPIQVATSAPVLANSAPAPVRTAPPPAEPPPQVAASTPAPMTNAQRQDKPGLLTRLNPFRSKPERTEPPRTGMVVVANTQAATTSQRDARGPATKAFPRYSYVHPEAPRAGNRTEAQLLFAEGVKAQRNGNAAEALRQYRAAISADPSFLDAQYQYAQLTMQQGDAQGALPLWETVLALDPPSDGARYNLALALKQAGYAQDAAAELETLVAAKPADSRAHLTLANLYAQQLGDTRRARDHYMKVIELDPRNPQAPAIRFWLAANP